MGEVGEGMTDLFGVIFDGASVNIVEERVDGDVSSERVL